MLSASSSLLQLASLPGYRGLDPMTRATAAHVLSVPKPPGSESIFHRPFEPATTTPTPAVNGYERPLTDHERLVAEREKMLAEHRRAQESAQKQAESRQRGLDRGAADSRNTGSVKAAPIANDAHRPYVTAASSAKAGQYATVTSSAHASQSRRTLLPNSKTSTYSSHRPKPPTSVSGASKASSLDAAAAAAAAVSQSALSSLQSFSQHASALSSLNNMIHSEHMLAARYDVNDKRKDGVSGSRLNGVHAAAPRARTAAESPADRRKRAHSGGDGAKHKHSPRKQSRSSNAAHSKNDKHNTLHYQAGLLCEIAAV